MRIVFNRCMMQRYRAILHLVDPIIYRGHELVLIVSTKDSINLNKFRKAPCDASESSPNTVRYISEAIGVKPRHLDCVKYCVKKGISADLYLDIDDRNQDKDRTFGIPYMGEKSYWKGKGIPTHNPMSDLIDLNLVEQKQNSVLIIHPGGGRGYVSPVRKEIDKKTITRNNIELLQTVLDALPDGVNRITIKTHPVPGARCSMRALEKFVVPELKFNGRITVRDMNLVWLINTHEYVLNFGGTTACWLIGTGKKWANIKGFVKYPSKTQREKLIEDRGGGITIDQITYINGSIPYTPYGAVDNIMRELNECAGV